MEKMSMLPYVLLVAALMAVAAILTLRVGLSKSNREGNPSYEQRTGGNLARLSGLYVVASIIALIALLYYFVWK